jgi:hypothetical protein
MEGLAQLGMIFRAGVDNGPYLPFLGDGLPVDNPHFIAVYPVPFGAAVGVAVFPESGVPGGFGQEYRCNTGLFPDKKMKTPVYPLFYPYIPGTYRQILGKKSVRAKTDQYQDKAQTFPDHVSLSDGAALSKRLCFEYI